LKEKCTEEKEDIDYGIGNQNSIIERKIKVGFLLLLKGNIIQFIDLLIK